MKASLFLLKRKLLLICSISFLFSIHTASAACNLGMGANQASSFCPGENMSITGITTSATSWEWLKDGNVIVAQGSGTKTYSKVFQSGDEGVYEFKAYDATCNASQIFTITQKPNYTFSVLPNPVLICKNDNIVLTAANTSGATTGITYSWTGNGGGPSAGTSFNLLTSLTGSGNVTVTGRATNYCVTTQTIPFTVTNLVLDTIGWSNSICKGASSTFTVDTTGTWTLAGGSLEVLWESKSPVQTTWTTMPNMANPLMQTVTPTQATRYRVTLTTKSASNVTLCQKTLVHSVSVIDLQMGAARTYDMCLNANISFQCETQTATQWQWLDEFRNVLSGWSSNIADQRLQNLYPNDTTTYYFVARNGSCIEEQAFVVNVKQYIDFSTNPPSVVACKGNVVNIVPTSTVPTTGVNYSWSVDGASAVNSNTFTLPTTIAKNGTVNVTPSATGYCAETVSIPYSVTDLLISPDNWPTTFCPGGSLPLNMNVSQIGLLPMTMEWYENGVAQGINAQSGVFNPTQTSTYMFEVSTAWALCSETYTQTIVMVNSNAIGEVKANNFSINLFPNPASETTTLKLTGVNGDVKIVLCDMLGKHLTSSVEKSEKGNLEKTLDVSALVQGVYLLKVECNGVEKSQLFMKK